VGEEAVPEVTGKREVGKSAFGSWRLAFAFSIQSGSAGRIWRAFLVAPLT
jgi:hypothetical protein